MSREFKREMERQKKREAALEPTTAPVKRERTGVRQFLGEVRGEMRRVHWPSRKEVASYSLVVLVAVSVIMLYIFLLDTLFGQAVFQIFS